MNNEIGESEHFSMRNFVKVAIEGNAIFLAYSHILLISFSAIIVMSMVL